MAEEITNEALVEESPLQETTIQESQTESAPVVESAPPVDERGAQMRGIYEILNKDEVYTKYVPKTYDEFVSTLSKDVNFAKGIHGLISGDEVYSKYLPATFDETVKYFGLGKPSAAPSASVSGGSAMKERGQAQPSTPQPTAPVNEQFGLGGIAAQIGQETGLSKEVNAFENYEDKQSYFAKVDKAKREIVDNKNSSYVLPNDAEVRQIYQDATGGRYDFLKREANSAQVKMSALLNPIIDKDIDESYLYKNDDGFLVPDTDKIDEYAKKTARKYNLPDDGYLKEVIYNEAKSKASFKEIEPAVNKRFEELLQPNLVSPGLIEKTNKEVWKGFTTDEVEQAELDKKVSLLSDDLKAKSKEESAAVQYGLQEQVANIDQSWQQLQAQASAQYSDIENQYKNGQIPYEQYTSLFNGVKAETDQAYAAYTDERLKLFDQGQKALNQVNNKYNGQLRRQAEELNNVARERVAKAAEEYQKKYGKNPKLEAEIKKLYEKAYLETVQAKGKEVADYNKNRATELILKYGSASGLGGMAAMADRFLRSVDSAAGGSLKGIGTTLGINALQLYGDFLEGTVTLPEAKTKEIKDLFDPLNLAQVSGQLGGGMAPTVLATAAVGATTKNAPLMYQMAATGVASFFTESADIAGRMHDETFARTQSAAKANEASAKSWESQYKIIPLYALSGLPFVSTAKTWIGTLPRVARVSLGALGELLEEIPQEVSQNIAEENIRAGKDPFDDYFKKVSAEDYKMLKETVISVAPVALLGGAGQLTGERQQTMKQQINSYAAKAKVNELIGNMQGQWVSQMVARKGDSFAVATVNALFAEGSIDEQTRDQLQENVLSSKKNFEDAKTLGLSQFEGVVYDALTQAYLQKKAQFEQAQENGDEILADNLNQDMTDIRNQTKTFAQSKQGDFFVFQFEDGTQKIVPNSKWTTDATIVDLIAKGQIAVSAYSDNGKSVLESLKPKVEEQKAAQKRTTEEKLKAQKEMEAEDAALLPTANPEDLKSVESIIQAVDDRIQEGSFDGNRFWDIVDSIPDGYVLDEYILQDGSEPRRFPERELAKAYHKAKEDGSNPELVKAVEELLAPKPPQAETTQPLSESRPIPENIEDTPGYAESMGMKPAPTLEAPEINIATPKNPFDASLEQLGYSEKDIQGMTMEQKQDIATNKTVAPVVESSAKVDSVKENKKQERIAEAQAKLDQEVAPVAEAPKPTEELYGYSKENPKIGENEEYAIELDEITPNSYYEKISGRSLDRASKTGKAWVVSNQVTGEVLFKGSLADAKSFLQDDNIITGKVQIQEKATTPTSEQAPESFPAQEGATAAEEKQFRADAELEQIYLDLNKAVTAGVDSKTLELLRNNPTFVMVEKALREMEKKGKIKINCK